MSPDRPDMSDRDREAVLQAEDSLRGYKRQEERYRRLHRAATGVVLLLTATTGVVGLIWHDEGLVAGILGAIAFAVGGAARSFHFEKLWASATIRRAQVHAQLRLFRGWVSPYNEADTRSGELIKVIVLLDSRAALEDAITADGDGGGNSS